MMQATLSGLCEDLEIPFQPTMLKYAKAIPFKLIVFLSSFSSFNINVAFVV